ncbi:MAG: hypothetical protein KDC38_21090, partial [Planctomycetes bacterium]|nr:hypothetical protein [Planctomycetota bacterium]
TVKARLEHGRLTLPFVSVESDSHHWELAGEVSRDGSLSLEGFRAATALLGFRRYSVPLSGTVPIAIRGSFPRWELSP